MPRASSATWTSAVRRWTKRWTISSPTWTKGRTPGRNNLWLAGQFDGSWIVFQKNPRARKQARFPGRTSRCSRQGRHYGFPKYFVFPAGPAAERRRSAAQSVGDRISSLMGWFGGEGGHAMRSYVLYVVGLLALSSHQPSVLAQVAPAPVNSSVKLRLEIDLRGVLSVTEK